MVSLNVCVANSRFLSYATLVNKNSNRQNDNMVFLRAVALEKETREEERQREC